MRRLFAGALLLVLVAGCGRGAVSPPTPAAPPAAAPAPVTSPAPPATAPAPALPAQVPAEPFWGAPGTTVMGSDGQMLSSTGAPLLINGLTLFPVMAGFPGATHYFARSGDQLVCAAVAYPMALFSGLSRPPEPITSLPYVVAPAQGRLWPFERVAALELLKTPAGTFATVVFATEDGTREWWSPGVGLVKKVDPDGKEVVADRVETGPPQPSGYIARMNDGRTLLATHEGIYGPDGPLAEFQRIDGRRPSVSWLDLGTGAPVLKLGQHSQGEPNWLESWYSYRPGTGRYEPVTWRFPDGARTIVAGGVTIAGATIRFTDDERYPRTTYSLRLVGDELQTTGVQEEYPKEERQFVAELRQPLRKESWIGLFADPELGRKAYDFAFRNGRNGLANAAEGFGPDGAWEYRGVWNNSTVRLTLVKTEKDWRVATWEIR